MSLPCVLSWVCVLRFYDTCVVKKRSGASTHEYRTNAWRMLCVLGMKESQRVCVVWGPAAFRRAVGATTGCLLALP